MDVMVTNDEAINDWSVPRVAGWYQSPLLELLKRSEFSEVTKTLRASAADAADCALVRRRKVIRIMIGG